ncbi:MAG TPA: hypothetical protein VKZ98_04785, partial [Aquaticitalea sp.]|nr:hypothetical protein [Aquaticitalea sp.]
MKQKKKNKSYKTRNLPPGTISYRGKKALSTTHIDIINYNQELHTVMESKNVEDGFNFKDKDTVTWINVNGLNNIDDIDKLGNH